MCCSTESKIGKSFNRSDWNQKFNNRVKCTDILLLCGYVCFCVWIFCFKLIHSQTGFESIQGRAYKGLTSWSVEIYFPAQNSMMRRWWKLSTSCCSSSLGSSSVPMSRPNFRPSGPIISRILDCKVINLYELQGTNGHIQFWLCLVEENNHLCKDQMFVTVDKTHPGQLTQFCQSSLKSYINISFHPWFSNLFPVRTSINNCRYDSSSGFWKRFFSEEQNTNHMKKYGDLHDTIVSLSPELALVWQFNQLLTSFTS